MTIDERVSVMMATLPLRMVDADGPIIREAIRSALLETAKDQREACAEAISKSNLVWKTKAAEIALAAEIK